MKLDKLTDDDDTVELGLATHDGPEEGEERADQFHLVIMWTEEHGFEVTEMEPSGDGFVWNEHADRWRYAETDADAERFAEMTRAILSLNDAEVGA